MSSTQHLAWVVLTNTNSCRIYNYSKKEKMFSLNRTIEHPENKLRDIDLTSDKPGHYATNGGAHGAFSQRSDPKKIKIDDFSREIARVLDHGRNTHIYKYLILIAPPQMHGYLFQHINKHVQELISHNIEKDILHLNEHELLEVLHTCTQPK